MIAPKVILVDDDRALRESLLRALRNEPYKLLAVSCAEECLEILTTSCFQVVVCDQKMPGVQGLDLLAYLKRSRPEIVRIVLSGNVTLDSAIDAVNECEVFRLLPKPCPSTELALSIRAALKHHNLITESKKLLELIHMQAAFIRNDGGEEPTCTSKLNLKANNNHSLEDLILEATKEIEKIEEFIKLKTH